MAERQQYYGTGRRKSSTARVFLRPGKGQIVINNRALEDYFGRETSCMVVCQPLETVEVMGKFDVYATVAGGGISGQAGAVRLGISRALDEVDETFHSPLRKHLQQFDLEDVGFLAMVILYHRGFQPLEIVDKTLAEAGEYQAALALWGPLAHQGVARAANNVGACFMGGLGVERDEALAIRWLTLAAEGGDAPGMRNLASAYFQGNGVAQDYATAAKWYERAAQLGAEHAGMRDPRG